MLETFIEFTFEAAHKIPPYSDIHGHTFRVVVYLQGTPDPVFGWSHNLYDVEAVVTDIKKQLDSRFLNDIEGLAVPSLENVAAWLWARLDLRLPGLDRVSLSRGMDGSQEGCVYSGRSVKRIALDSETPNSYASPTVELANMQS